MTRRIHRPIITFALLGLGISLAASLNARMGHGDQASVLNAPAEVDAEVLGL